MVGATGSVGVGSHYHCHQYCLILLLQVRDCLMAPVLVLTVNTLICNFTTILAITNWATGWLRMTSQREGINECTTILCTSKHHCTDMIGIPALIYTVLVLTIYYYRAYRWTELPRVVIYSYSLLIAVHMLLIITHCALILASCN